MAMKPIIKSSDEFAGKVTLIALVIWIAGSAALYFVSRSAAIGFLFGGAASLGSFLVLRRMLSAMSLKKNPGVFWLFFPVKITWACAMIYAAYALGGSVVTLALGVTLIVAVLVISPLFVKGLS